MAKRLTCTLFLILTIFTITTIGNAADTKASIKKRLELPVTDYQGGCLKSVLSKSFDGKELFSTEKCPFVKTATIDITPETETATAAKGKLKITMQCTIKNHDYYAGKLRKSFDEEKEATITADYIYALEELALKNVDFEGDKFCVHPIMKRMKKFQ